MLIATRRRLLVALFVPAFLAVSAVAALAATESSTPKLSIPIPTINLSEIARSNGEVTVAWLPEYIVGLYNYGLTIGGVIAVVMMMFGGFKWMTGDPSGGKTKIENAAVGLVILFGAYVILSVVNPTLTQLKSITIKTVAEQTLTPSLSSESKRLGEGGMVASEEVVSPGSREKLSDKCLRSVKASGQGGTPNAEGTMFRPNYGLASSSLPSNKAPSLGKKITCPIIELPSIYTQPQDTTMPPASSCPGTKVTQEMRDGAKAMESKTGVPAYILLAQMGAETSYSPKFCAGYNCFNIKCYKSSGGGQDRPTNKTGTTGTKPNCGSECRVLFGSENNFTYEGTHYDFTYTWACYQYFDKMEDAANAHAKAFRRGNWKDYTKNPVGMVRWLGAMNYATASDYANLVLKVMRGQCLVPASALAVPANVVTYDAPAS